MLHTYKAILKDNCLEWEKEAPAQLARGEAVAVHVTILEEPVTDAAHSEQGRRMAEILEQIAASGGVAEIPDPLAWEREIRQDRPLPGREP